MRNMLAFLAALTLTLIAVGWYLDWYKVRTTPAPSGRRSVTVDINTQKIGADFRHAEEKIHRRLAEKIDKDHAASEADPTSPDVTVEEDR